MAAGEPLGVLPDVIHRPNLTGTGVEGLAATPSRPLRRRLAIPLAGIALDGIVLVGPDRFISCLLYTSDAADE